MPTLTDTVTLPPPDSHSIPQSALRTVTIVIATRNRRESLRKCLESLLAADLRGVSGSIHVVNDGSTDGTEELLREMSARVEGPLKIRYTQEQGRGTCVARNRALETADTDLILSIDDDCIADAQWVQSLAFGPWDESVGCLAGHVRIAPVEEETWVSRFCRRARMHEFPRHPGPLHSADAACAAFPTALLKEVGGYEPVLTGGGEDIDLAMRLARLGYSLRYVPEAIVDHYPKTTYEGLVRSFYLRGYISTYRRALWGVRITPAGFLVEVWYYLGRLIRIFGVPVEIFSLRFKGVSWEEAAGFAYLRYLRPVSGRWGRLKMQWELLTGKRRIPEADLKARAGGPVPSAAALDE